MRLANTGLRNLVSPPVGGDDRLSVNATLKYMPQRGGPIPGPGSPDQGADSSQRRRVPGGLA